MHQELCKFLTFWWSYGALREYYERAQIDTWMQI